MKPYYVVFTGKDGYPKENEEAHAVFEIGKQCNITDGTISGYSTELKIKGFKGT